MLPATIDAVVDRLDEIVQNSIASGDRRGYFAALYNRVTQAVREGARRGEFEDGERMARFDVLFANRYLEAYDLASAGARPTEPWAIAFGAAKRDGLFVVQHLMLGMVAHIMFDLGLALATFGAETPLPAMRNDYMRINDLLAEEVGKVEDQLVEIARLWKPDVGALLRVAENVAHGAERSAAQRVMDEARAQAWDFAVRLLDAPDEAARTLAIEQHGLATIALEDAVRVSAPVGELVGNDGEDIATNVRVLARGE